MNSVATKRALRAQNRAARLELTAEAYRERCAALVAQLAAFDELTQARCVASFWPMLERRELDLRPLHDTFLAQRKVIAYPYMQDGELGFRQCGDTSELVANPWGFLEPSARCRRVVERELSIIIVPALALTRSGKRLGYGAGFYDRVLPSFRPPARVVGCCYEAELLEELPTEPHDQVMDWIATEHGVFACR